MDNRPLAQEYRISRSPTVKVFGKDKSAPTDYEDARKKVEMVEFLNNYAITEDYIAEVPKSQHQYNIKAIINEISEAHDARIEDIDNVHREELIVLAKELDGETKDLEEKYNGYLAELTDVGKERIAIAAEKVDG